MVRVGTLVCLSTLLLLAVAASALQNGEEPVASADTAGGAHVSITMQSGEISLASGASGSSGSGSSSAASESAASSAGAEASGEEAAAGIGLQINFPQSEEKPEPKYWDELGAHPGMSPLGGPVAADAGEYAAVRGTQTEAEPTPWTAGEAAATPAQPTYQAAPQMPMHPNTILDTPIVSGGVPPPSVHKKLIEQLDDMKVAREARLDMQNKAGLHVAIANAQDQLMYIQKMQREIRYQYSELDLQHKGIQRQVKAAQEELREMNKERPAFKGSENEIGLPLKDLPPLIETPRDPEEEDPHANIEKMLKLLLDKMDRIPEPAENQKERLKEEKQKAMEASRKAEQNKKKEETEKEEAKKAESRAQEEKKKADLPPGFASKIPIPQSQIKAEKAEREAKELEEKKKLEEQQAEEKKKLEESLTKEMADFEASFK